METVLLAEEQAVTLLSGYWADLTIPVSPDELAKALGIKVEYVALPSDESGKITMADEQSPVITINRNDTKNRQRFTCAHEIGHYIRNRELERSENSVDYRSTLAGIGIDSDEIFANQFAAALLMPAIEVKRVYDAGWDVDRLARHFVTSTLAMELRLKNLRLVR
jgi:Zn-dependent peptidase ImmA (M78 family)